MKTCAYRECRKQFKPNRKNQKYCDTECCKQELNQRARDLYAERKIRLGGSRRICNGCGNILSQYNEDNLCSSCLKRPDVEILAQLKDLVNGTDR